MMIEKLTTTMQQALGDAQQVAITRQQQQIDIPHVWLVLLQPDHFAYNVYHELGTPMKEFKERIEREIDAISSVTGSNIQYGQSISSKLNQLLIDANTIAQENKDEYISTEVVLLALYKQVHNPLTKWLNEHHITEEKLKERITTLRGGERVTSQNQEQTYESLEKYATNLVLAVKQGKLDPVIGRDEEIRDVIRILSRKTKNNPILIG